MRFLSWLVTTAIAVAVAAWLIDGIRFTGPREWPDEFTEKLLPLLLVALILGVVTSLVKPVLTVLSIPFIIVTLGLYLFVILRSLEAARLAKDRLGAYLVLGVLACFTFQVIYNITMSAGLAPVKGLTLPLMSYGGSSMIATLAGFGLILNVRMRRFTN